MEIGGDVNSTDGTEPSHARTREEFEHPRPEYFDRGYEWWLMREAKKRNPQIYLDVLQWGAPAGSATRIFPTSGDPNALTWEDRMQRNRKKFYTQDNADFIVGFIQGAKKYHGLDIDFCGIWNETAVRRAVDQAPAEDARHATGLRGSRSSPPTSLASGTSSDDLASRTPS